MKNFHLPILILVLFFCSCQHTTEQALGFSHKIEMAHHKTNFDAKGVIRFDLRLVFGSRELFKGKITMNSGTSKIRLDYEDGKTLLFDGQDIYLSPDSLKGQSGRGALFTWSYFFALPYKLNDPGTHWQPTPSNTLNEITYESQLLTFGDQVGDSPKDWYIVYADQKTHLIKYAAYIATGGGGDVAKAEEDPHAIEYLDYQEFDGIPVATKWKFWEWRKAEGLTKELGGAELSNIEFIEEGTLFQIPENSRKLGD